MKTRYRVLSLATILMYLMCLNVLDYSLKYDFMLYSSVTRVNAIRDYVAAFLDSLQQSNAS